MARIVLVHGAFSDSSVWERVLPGLREAAGCDSVLELDTDHCPWVSRVDELVEALDGLARG